MPILKGKEHQITKNLGTLEKNLGVDLKLTKDGDLELSNLNDLKAVAGADNAAQALSIKLNIEPGSLAFHPDLGAGLSIGSKTKDAFQIKTQILRSVSKDERFTNVQATVQVINGLVIVKLKVTLKDTGIEVPLQFAVPV